MILVDSSNVLCANGCRHHLGWRRARTHSHTVFPASWTSPRILADVPGAPLSVSIVTSLVFFCLSSPFPLSPFFCSAKRRKMADKVLPQRVSKRSEPFHCFHCFSWVFLCVQMCTGVRVCSLSRPFRRVESST